MEQTIQIRETSSETPICPHCDKAIHTVNSSKVKARFGVRFIYFCSHCRKVLGVSHRKGFWMG
jgi:uncharacterized protein with PIN domain